MIPFDLRLVPEQKQNGGVHMQANQMPFDTTVGMSNQKGGIKMNKQTEVKVLVVSDKNVRFAKEARIASVITTIHRGLYEVLRVANGTRKITVSVYEKTNVQNAVQATISFKGYRKEKDTIYAQLEVKEIMGNEKLVPNIQNIHAVVVPDLEFPKQEPQRRRVKAVVEQAVVKHSKEAMSHSEPVKQTKQEMKKEEQPMTELQACLHNMLKVTKDKKTRQQLIALAAHIEHKGYEVDAGQFAKYAAAIGNYDFDRIIARVDEIHGAPREELDETLIERVRNIAKEELQKHGIDLSNKEAVMRYIMTHKDEILKKVQQNYNNDVIPELAGPMHDQLMKYILERNNFNDIAIHVIVQGFGARGPEYADYAYKFTEYFNNPRKMGEYVRKVLSKDKKFTVKNAVYYTADTTRATGDLIQKGFELAGRGINYLFYAVADLIEKPVGGRPEYLEGVNLVKTAVKQKFQFHK